jgi:hypothetical protein
VTLRARWVTLRARWVTLRARWVMCTGSPALFYGEVPAAQLNPVSDRGLILGTWTDACSSEVVAEGFAPAVVSLIPNRLTLLASETRLTHVGDVAACAPMSIPTRAQLTVLLGYEGTAVEVDITSSLAEQLTYSLSVESLVAVERSSAQVSGQPGARAGGAVAVTVQYGELTASVLVTVVVFEKLLITHTPYPTYSGAGFSQVRTPLPANPNSQPPPRKQT